MENRKVILLDDEEMMLNSLERRFKYEGEEYQLECFTSAKEALLELEKGPCHAFVTDVQMPLISGDQVVSYIHKKFPKQVCLVITGHADKAVIQRIIKVGNVQTILLKPLDFYKLKEALDSIQSK